MNRTHEKIAAFCRNPQTIDAIVDHVKCTKAVIYLLRQRGMLRNIGNKRGGLFQVVEGISVEPVRMFETPNNIIQATSIWHYARRFAMESRHEA